MRLVACVLAAALLLGAGCDSEDEAEGPNSSKPDSSSERTPSKTAAGEEQVVRGWIEALNARDIEEAAGYFAKGAIVDQGRPFKLRDAAAAKVFNATLPCSAELVEVEDEPGPDALASFTLGAGPGGPCEGTAQVRVTVKDGRFTEWRQLAQAPGPEGPVI